MLRYGALSHRIPASASRFRPLKHECCAVPHRSVATPPTLWVLPDQNGMRGPMAHEFPRYRQNRHFIIIRVKTHGFGGLQADAE